MRNIHSQKVGEIHRISSKKSSIGKVISDIVGGIVGAFFIVIVLGIVAGLFV